MRPDLPAVSTAGLARSRRAATAVLLGLGSLAAPPRATLAACAPRRLLASRAQVDLAVQASSVKAWADAAEAASDGALDPASLAAGFDACAADGPDDRQEFVAGVGEMRAQLRALGERDSGDADDAMRAMRTGTATRNAIDRYLRTAGVDE